MWSDTSCRTKRRRLPGHSPTHVLPLTIIFSRTFARSHRHRFRLAFSLPSPQFPTWGTSRNRGRRASPRWRCTFCAKLYLVQGLLGSPDAQEYWSVHSRSQIHSVNPSHIRFVTRRPLTFINSFRVLLQVFRVELLLATSLSSFILLVRSTGRASQFRVLGRMA